MLATAQYILRKLLGAKETEQLIGSQSATAEVKESSQEPLLELAFNKLEKLVGEEAAKVCIVRNIEIRMCVCVFY